MFSIIYAGASGAMQPFSKRDLTQDDMLKIIAYIRSLDQKK
jgi:cytochrome c-L